MNAKRLDYLDYTKGFGILLVIIGHIFNSDTIIKTWIYSFHMPLFFIISGCLFKIGEINIRETFKKKIKHLIIPYILFSCLMILLKLLIYRHITGEIKSYILYFVTGTGFDALWFLLCLFITEILYCIINKYIKNKIVLNIIICILFFIGLYGKDIYSNLILVTIYRSFIALGFFTIGSYTFDYVKNNNISYVAIIILVAILTVLAVNNKCVDLWGLRFNNKILYIICSIIGSYFSIFLFKRIATIREFKLLEYFGRNSLIIMATHQIILEFFNKILNISFDGFLLPVTILLVVLIIEIPIIYIVNNYLPFMIGKFKKKEKVQTITD
ncbi:MAG: acyltransferase family protein [Intestinibacter bartlettii]|nr:acyltransferase family protein [Intestinibacter bartlettii]